MAKKHFWSICTDSTGYQTFCSIWFRIFLVALIVGFVIWHYSHLSEEDKERIHQGRHRRRRLRIIIGGTIAAGLVIYYIINKVK